VALPTFPAVVERLLLTAGTPAVQQSTDIFCPLGPQQQTRRSDRIDRQTDRQTKDSFIDPAAHYCAGSANNASLARHSDDIIHYNNKTDRLINL